MADDINRLVPSGGIPHDQSVKAWPDERVALFARTTFRNEGRAFGIRQVDRRSHVYIIGKSGTGKSTLIETLIRQDIGADQGVALIDPHGDLVERVVAAIPERRRCDLIYFDAPDTSQVFGFNPLEHVVPAKRALAASFLLESFKKIWWEFWGPRLEHVLRNALLALLDQPEATLADVPRLFDDRSYRRAAAERVANTQVRHFWLREYESYPARLRAEAIAPIQNKVGAFLAHPILNSILTQRRSSFNLRDVMDQGRILLINLSKGRLGEDASSLLGSLLVSVLGLAALSRADQPENQRRDFFLLIDEFQTFTTLSLANMLTDLRKFRVGLTLAHQHLSQLEPKVRDAILGNVGTTISFRVGANDAEILEKELSPEFAVHDLVCLPNYHIYLKLMINGVVSRPFSAEVIKFTGGA